MSVTRLVQAQIESVVAAALIAPVKVLKLHALDDEEDGDDDSTVAPIYSLPSGRAALLLQQHCSGFIDHTPH